MVLKPRAVPPPIWFSLVLAMEGVVMFCLMLLTVDPGILATVLLKWLQGDLTIRVGVFLQLTLAAGVFAGTWAASATVSTLGHAARRAVNPNRGADDWQALRRAA